MTETLKISRTGGVVLIRIDRPKQMNALNAKVAGELVTALEPLDSDPEVGCFVLTDMLAEDYPAIWERFGALRTPKIAAVNGYALGGGCELSMMCDFIIAGEGAQFGQPEIKLGIIPGIGGSQRLTRLVGRAKAMDMVLTGRMMGAAEAEASGLVARVVADDKVVETAMEAAAQIASYSKPAVQLAREAVNRAEEAALSEGLLYERRLFQSLFATHDQKEGMAAFIEKRKPAFTGN